MSWPRLHTLHMERCGLESTECLPVLPALLELRLGGNRLESVRALMPLVQCAPILRVLWLVEGNLDVSAGNSGML